METHALAAHFRGLILQNLEKNLFLIHKHPSHNYSIFQ